MIEVLYFAEFKSITNKEKEKFQFNNHSLFELLEKLFEKYPEMKSLVWNEDKNDISDEISIAINHNIVNKKNALPIELSDNDVIALLMPVAGG